MENRTFWSNKDTRALLCIWADKNVQRRFDGACRNENVMEYIVAELSKRNIQRTTVQVREKLKKLRARYKFIKNQNDQKSAKIKKFPFFKIMDGVLGNRPSVSGKTTRNTMSKNITVDLPSHSTLEIQNEEGPSTPPLCESTTDLPSHSPFVEIKKEEGPSTPPLCASTTDLPSHSTFLLIKNEEGPSTPQLCTFTTGIHNSAELIIEGSHHISPSSHTESHKHKADMSFRDYVQCTHELSQKRTDEEREIRRLDREAEMAMRREELELNTQLRREEMLHRENEMLCREKQTEAFSSALSNVAATLLQSTSVIRGGSHHTPPRTRTKIRKRKANSASKYFLQCMRELSQNQMDEEREIRRLDREAEMAMRREELEIDAQLRREEMLCREKEMQLREKETEAFTSVLSNLAAALLQRK